MSRSPRCIGRKKGRTCGGACTIAAPSHKVTHRLYFGTLNEIIKSLILWHRYKGSAEVLNNVKEIAQGV